MNQRIVDLSAAVNAMTVRDMAQLGFRSEADAMQLLSALVIIGRACREAQPCSIVGIPDPEKKIGAIKVLREVIDGMSLADAKRAVESVIAGKPYEVEPKYAPALKAAGFTIKEAA